MVQKKKDTSSDDVYRILLREKTGRKAKVRMQLKQILFTCEVEYQTVYNWLHGRKDAENGHYYPSLKLEERAKVLACLRAVFPREMNEIEHEAPMRALFEEADRVATYVREPTELDRFVEFVANGAVITSASAYSVTAEGGESTRTYEPMGGLTEEVYRRLATDDLLWETQEELAWGVIDNLLLKRGVTMSQVGQARCLVPMEITIDLIEANSFEAVADALAAQVKKCAKGKE